MRNTAGRTWLSWGSVIVLSLLCGFLGFLQYRSIGEISTAERSRLHEELRSRLDAFRRGFDDEISSAALGLMPVSEDRYEQWRKAHGQLFKQIALVARQNSQLVLLNLDSQTGRLLPAEWPLAWRAMQQQMEERLDGQGRGAMPSPSPLVFEIPQFGPGPGGREQGWLILELDSNYLRDTVLPEMLTRYLGESSQRDYDVEVTAAADSREVIYSSISSRGEITPGEADDTTGLLDIRPVNSPGPGRPFGPPPRGPRFQRGPRGPEPPGQGRLRLLVRHKAGSLEALVAQTRRRNLGISAAVLLLILATVGMLLRFTRQSQRLAELQINFVAGISHELRTPLTVIRTAAYNLRSTHLQNRPEQIERYGRLIETESRQLEEVVEQVLRFASAKAGHAIRDRQPVAIGSLIEDELLSIRATIEGAGVVLEEHIGSRLPLVLADAGALRHTIQNLLDNALKYGTKSTAWIGVNADAIIDEIGTSVQIRVADRGPGIPLDEQEHIFDPFFRGSHAVQDQIRGTGIGLNLVKTIVEAHGGSIHVTSDAENGTEFTIRIPAAPAEFQPQDIQNEFTHSAG